MQIMLKYVMVMFSKVNPDMWVGNKVGWRCKDYSMHFCPAPVL